MNYNKYNELLLTGVVNCRVLDVCSNDDARLSGCRYDKIRVAVRAGAVWQIPSLGSIEFMER
jgi:hypothetical protein